MGVKRLGSIGRPLRSGSIGKTGTTLGDALAPDIVEARGYWHEYPTTTTAEVTTTTAAPTTTTTAAVTTTTTAEVTTTTSA